MIQDGVLQIHVDHVLAGRLIGAGQLHGILFRAQQPALGHGDFLHVVIPMREHTGECQIALGIRGGSSHQGIGGQLLIVAIGDDIGVVQAEHKALAGNHFNGLMDHAFLGFGYLDVFLFLAQRHTDGQIGIGSRNLDLNDRRLLVHSSQSHVIRCAVKHIAVRGRHFLQVILAQGQHLGFDRAGAAGGQFFNQGILFIKHRAFLADNILGSVQLKDRTGQETVLENRLHDGVATGVFFICKANQLHTGLFQRNIAAHRRIGNIQRNGYGVIRCVSIGNLKAGQQHHHGQHQVKKAFHIEHILYPPQLFDPDSGGIAGIKVAIRHTCLDDLIFAPGQKAGFGDALRVSGNGSDYLPDVGSIVRLRPG